MMDRPRRVVLLGVPVLLTLHNAEEALFAPGALRAIAGRVPPRLADAIPAPGQVYFALAVATLVPWMLWLRFCARRETPAGTRLLLLLQSFMLVNVAWHVVASVALRGYAPGLATALVLNLPFSVWLLGRAAREGWVPRRLLAGMLGLAVLVHGLGVAVLLRTMGGGTVR